MADGKTSITQCHHIIGSPGKFESGNDIIIFESRLTNFFIANGITNEVQKKAIFLYSISEEVHKILFSLCVPHSPDTLTTHF